MDYLTLPPEVNSARMYAGPGATPLMEASLAWQGLATQLSLMASSITDVITGLESVWSGPSSLEMKTTLMRYVTWLQMTAEQASETSGQALAAVAAYEAAFSATVAPALVAANRALLAALVSTNFLGIHTAAIAATEAHYMEMWAQDVAAMTAYHAESAQATVLPRFTVPNPLAGLLDIFKPGSNQSSTGLAGLMNLISGSNGSAFGSFLNATIFNGLISSGVYYNLPQAVIQGITQPVALTSLGQTEQQIEIAQANANPSNQVESSVDAAAESPVEASVGGAGQVGALSTPRSWGQTVNPRLVAAESSLTGTPENAAPLAGGFCPVGSPAEARRDVKTKGFALPVVKVVLQQVGS